MYIIKATFKNDSDKFVYYVGKVMKNRMFTIQNRSIDVDPDKVTGYKNLSKCRKAMYVYFLDSKEIASKSGCTLSVEYIER